MTTTRHGSTFASLDPMPEPRHSHCLAVVDSDTLFVGGGFPDEDKAYLYRRSSHTWTQLPDMITNRTGHACQAVDASGRGVGREIVVVGGSEGKTELSVVDVFNLKRRSWRRAGNHAGECQYNCPAINEHRFA